MKAFLEDGAFAIWTSLRKSPAEARGVKLVVSGVHEGWCAVTKVLDMAARLPPLHEERAGACRQEWSPTRSGPRCPSSRPSSTTPSPTCSPK